MDFSTHRADAPPRLAALLLLLLLTPLFPAVAAHAETPGEKVVLQLKWRHQFQFAGYYAAVLQGYYRAEGLEVEIREGAPDRPPVEALLSGNADFCVSDADGLLARMRGMPIVALATIYQHSPYVLLTRDRHINTPSDLIGGKIMAGGNQGTALFKAMFLEEGIPADRVRFVPHAWRMDELIDGTVDAVSAYGTDDYPVFREKGFKPGVIRPAEYGIDFYGDTLFTTEALLEREPRRVISFRRASLKGWKYAMAHVEEMAGIISAMPGVRERGIDREFLVRESAAMRRLILPDVVEIGHMNPARWEQMAKAFGKTGIQEGPYTLRGFVYEPHPKRAWPRIMLWAIAACALMGGASALWILRLRRSVRKYIDALRMSGQRFRQLVESSPMPTGIAGTDGTIEYVNPVFVATFGYRREDVPSLEEWFRKAFPDPAYRQDAHRRWKEYMASLAAGTPPSDGIEIEIACKDGSIRQAELFPSAQGDKNFAVFRDITDRKRIEEEKEKLQAQLRQAMKMEAVGRLAGGVAHDYNNLLTVVTGYCDLLLRKTMPDSAMRGEVIEIRRAGERAAQLTQQLLAFSRKQIIEPKVVNLAGLVTEVHSMLVRLVGENIELQVRAGKALGLVKIDPSQFHQILVNLVVNARDAMPDGGRILIETANAELGEEFFRNHPGGQPGRYVLLAVTDSGQGMTEEVKEHIFEPFYTTKPKGRGTGLGLSTTYGAVKQSGGMIEVDTAVGRGTTFRIYFPMTAKEATETEKETESDDLPRGSGTILLAEDEESVRGMCARILEDLGYEVMQAANGAEAIALATKHGNRFDLLMTDVVMPGMNGNELATRVKAIHPAIRVLFTSGYTENAIVRQGVLNEGIEFIGKPYSPSALATKIRDVLAKDRR